jgi:hypothetical protein
LVDITIYREESFATNLAIEYNLGFNILDSKIYYTIDDTSSKHYNEINLEIEIKNWLYFRCWKQN